MTRVASYLGLALGLAALAGGALGEPAKDGLSWKLDCSAYIAPEQLPFGKEIRWMRDIEINSESDLQVAWLEGGRPFVGDVILKGQPPVIAGVFETAEKFQFLSLQSGRFAYVSSDDGDSKAFNAGQLLSDRIKKVLKVGNRKCVRIREMDVFVTPAVARDMGYEVKPDIGTMVLREDGVFLPFEGPGSYFETIEEPEGSLGGLFTEDGDKPETPGAKGPGSLGDIASEAGAGRASEPSKPTGGGGLAGLVPAKPETPVTPKPEISAPVEAVLEEIRKEELPGRAVCHASTGTVGDLYGPLPDTGYGVVGRVRMPDPVRAFTWDAIAQVLDPVAVTATLAPDYADQLVLLGQPVGLNRIAIAEGGPVRIATPLDPGVVTLSAVTPEAPSGEAAIRLLVASDAARLAESGLDRLETALVAAHGQRLWQVDWAEIRPDGAVLPAVSYPDLTALVAAAAGREDEVDLQDAAQFDKVMTGFETVLTDPGKAVTKFLWVVEGQRLPHSAPARFEAMILRVNDAGNIARKPRGEPRKWLEVIAGQFTTGFAEGYLEGPSKTSQVGEMTVEDRKGASDRDVILTDVDGLAARITTALDAAYRATGGAKPEPVATFPTEGLVYDRDGLVSEAGLLVARAAYGEFIAALGATQTSWDNIENDTTAPVIPGTLDALSLVAFSTRDNGALATRSLRVKMLERRIALARSDPAQAAALSAQRTWLARALPMAVTRSADPQCDYIFFPDSGL